MHLERQCTLHSELERKEANFVPLVKNKINLIEYIEDLSLKALQETGQRNSYHSTFHSLAIHIEMCFGGTMLKDLNKGMQPRNCQTFSHRKAIL